jgi:hypothetical protein
VAAFFGTAGVVGGLQPPASAPVPAVSHWSGAGVHKQNADQQVHWGSVALPPRCQGFVARITWRDQGWGNSKGRVGLPRSFGVGENMFGRLAPQARAEDWAVCDFTPTSGDHGSELPIMYVVGGGGGHELRVEQMHVLAFGVGWGGVLEQWGLLIMTVKYDGLEVVPRPPRAAAAGAAAAAWTADELAFGRLVKAMALAMPQEVIVRVCSFVVVPFSTPSAWLRRAMYAYGVNPTGVHHTEVSLPLQ